MNRYEEGYRYFLFTERRSDTPATRLAYDRTLRARFCRIQDALSDGWAAFCDALRYGSDRRR